MGATGGCLKEMTYRGRSFKGTGDSVPIINSIGGDTVEHLPNGDRTTRRKKTTVPWHVSGIKVEIDHQNNDLQFLQDGVNSDDDGDISLTLQDGSVYVGFGDIEGELPNDASDASAEFEMMGGGTLKKLS